MEGLTPSQLKWFTNYSQLKNKKIVFDHLTNRGEAIFSVEDNDKYATACVGKRGHFEYTNVTPKINS